MAKKFISLNDVIKSFSPEEQVEIEEGSRAMILTHEMSKLKGREVQKMSSDLKKFGAKLFVRMPTGREVEMPFPGVHV